MLTRAELDALLAGYEAMAAAARANDWSQLATLEAGLARLRDAAMARTAQAGGDAAALPAQEQQTLAEGIARILELDAEIRTHTDPFLASARKFLSGRSRERAVRNAYTSLAP